MLNYNDHNSYKIGYDLANIIWKIVKRWDRFTQDTLGKQFVRSVDSISANIAEGWHRYYKKDKILFFTYSKSSFYETVDYINKAIKRRLITKDELNILTRLIQSYPKEINGLIKGTRTNLKK